MTYKSGIEGELEATWIFKEQSNSIIEMVTIPADVQARRYKPSTSSVTIKIIGINSLSRNTFKIRAQPNYPAGYIKSYNPPKEIDLIITVNGPSIKIDHTEPKLCLHRS